MPVIPPEILPILEQLGITDPTSSRWQRRESWPPGIRAHHFCPCGTRSDGQQKVELHHAWLAGRRVFVGQCQWCKTIYWRDIVKE
jgi:hypothetical protein